MGVLESGQPSLLRTATGCGYHPRGFAGHSQHARAVQQPFQSMHPIVQIAQLDHITIEAPLITIKAV